MGEIKTIGVLTSGGDAPGMNAAIRAIVRTAIASGLNVKGIMRGYAGLLNEEIIDMDKQSVSEIMRRGGTILYTARCKEFMTEEGQQKAAEILKKHGIDGLIVIGGDGSFRGAQKLSALGINTIGIPGTIDNDLYGTDSTIGYDTAVNTAVEAVDKIKDTASAHNRLFFVEVMGRDAGFIALRTAIATGAEAVLVPEVETDLTDLEHFIEKDYNPKTSSGIVIVAEGEKSGGAYSIAEKVAQKHPEYDIRVSVLGHMQRGGSPSQFDRVLASQLGAAAVDALMDDQKSIMLGIMNKEIVHVPFNKTIKHTKNLNPELLNLVRILSI